MGIESGNQPERGMNVGGPHDGSAGDHHTWLPPFEDVLPEGGPFEPITPLSWLIKLRSEDGQQNLDIVERVVPREQQESFNAACDDLRGSNGPDIRKRLEDAFGGVDGLTAVMQSLGEAKTVVEQLDIVGQFEPAQKATLIVALAMTLPKPEGEA
jgi:hypothetical protein